MNEELKRLTSALNSATIGTEPRYRVSPLKCSLVIHGVHRDQSDLLIPIPCEPDTFAALKALLLQMVNSEILASEEQIVVAKMCHQSLEETDEDTK